LTKEKHIRLESLPFLGSKDPYSVHEVTIVILDTTGRRKGEAVYSIELRTAS